MLLAALAPGVPARPTPTPAATAIIDINSADEKTLMTIPGIGPVYSKKIVAGRPYRRKDELVARKILPPGVYDKIKERLIAKQK